MSGASWLVAVQKARGFAVPGLHYVSTRYGIVSFAKRLSRCNLDQMSLVLDLLLLFLLLAAKQAALLGFGVGIHLLDMSKADFCHV